MEWTSLNGRYYLMDVQGLTTGSSNFNLVTIGANNTKGGFFPVARGVDYDSDGILINLSSDLSRDVLLDFSTVSGTSQIIISNLYWSPAVNAAITLYLPIKVAANTPFFVRGQQSTATATLTVGVGIVYLHKGWNDVELFDRMTNYSEIPGVEVERSIDPGGTPNTWGPWVTITSGTVYQIESFLIMIGDDDNVTMTDGFYLFEVGVGPVSQEVPIFRGAMIASSQDDMYHPTVIGPVNLSIPQGTRIAMRGQCSITDATDRIFTAAFYGFD